MVGGYGGGGRSEVRVEGRLGVRGGVRPLLRVGGCDCMRVSDFGVDIVRLYVCVGILVCR